MREVSYHKAIDPTRSEGNRDALRKYEGPQPDVLDEAVDPHLQSCRQIAMLLATYIIYMTLYYITLY